MYTVDGDFVWEEYGGEAIDASPLVLDGVVYVGSSDTNVYAYTVDGELLWTFETDDEVDTSPVAFGGRLIVSSRSTLYSILLPGPVG